MRRSPGPPVLFCPGCGIPNRRGVLCSECATVQAANRGGRRMLFAEMLERLINGGRVYLRLARKNGRK